MNRNLTHGNQQHDGSLTLFVSGEAPGSRRARRNLIAALDATGLNETAVSEIDLLHEPQQAILYGIFAAPALLHVDTSGQNKMLYGDLSNTRGLEDFLSAL